MGTGDGLYVYKCAQQDPHRFFIGIDANRRPLQKVSEKIYRRPAKGGLPNILFLQAAVENLPEELQGIASEVLVQFPWGSLLRGITAGDVVVMNNLRRISYANALLRVTIGVDPQRDCFEWERLELPWISLDYIKTVLATRYRSAGFKITKAEEVSWPDPSRLQTSWARRLQGGTGRSLIVITARAIGDGD